MCITFRYCSYNAYWYVIPIFLDNYIARPNSGMCKTIVEHMATRRIVIFLVTVIRAFFIVSGSKRLKLRHIVLLGILTKRCWNRFMKVSWHTLIRILIQVVMHILQFQKVCIFVEWFDTYQRHNFRSLTSSSGVWDMSIVPYALGCDIIFVLKSVYQEGGAHFLNLLYFNDSSLLNKFNLLRHVFILI